MFSAGVILFHVKDKSRNYLLLHYPQGHWGLPKGNIEKGESKEKAALRELQEETGLSAQILPTFEVSLDYFFKNKGELTKKTVYFFLGQAFGDTVTLSDEHIGYAWLPFQQAIDRLTFDNAREILQKGEAFLSKSEE